MSSLQNTVESFINRVENLPLILRWIIKGPIFVITTPMAPIVVVLAAFTSHHMYVKWVPVIFISSAILGASGALLLPPPSFPLWLLILFLFPEVWSNLIFGWLIPLPFEGWGYLCPDTDEVYKTCTIYMFIANMPSLIVLAWAITSTIRWLI